MSGRNNQHDDYCEEGFPHKEWQKFPWFYYSGRKTMQEFKQAWMECGAYDPVNKIWSEEKMNIHLNELYRAECGLAGCLKRLRPSGELLADCVKRLRMSDSDV